MDRYRLRPLQDVRRLDERAKRNDLAGAVHDGRATAEAVAAAAARVTAARTRLTSASAARDALVAGGVHAARLALADRYVARRRGELDDAIAAHARATAAHAGRQHAIDTARDRLTAARADRELVERHFARWRETQRKLADRRED